MDAEHVTQHEAYVLTSTLLTPRVSKEYLELCGQILQERHLRVVIEERAVQWRCGMPTCSNLLAKKKLQKYRISMTKKEVYDAREEQQFCSKTCMIAARRYIALLPVKPLQMLPSLHQVFGTSKPNPADYRWNTPTTTPPVVGAPARARSNRSQRPQPKLIWSKEPGMGVVERSNEKKISIVENKAPANASREFPTGEHAVRIEGFVFPAHKAKKASKMAKKMSREVAETNEDESDYTSESDSGTDTEMEILLGDQSSEDSEGNTDVYSMSDLSTFANLWHKVSEMVTTETLVKVASWNNRTIPIICEVKPMSSAMEERLNVFGSFLLRHITAISEVSGLSWDRRVQGLLQELVYTFHLLRPVDAKETNEWNAMCFLFLLICHGHTAETLESLPTLSQTLGHCSLEHAEMKQLVHIFYNTDSLTTMVLADDMNRKLEIVQPPLSKSKGISKKQCRKCRRATDVCICEQRIREDHNFSDADVSMMLEESLKLQEMVSYGTVDDKKDSVAIENESMGE
ncbi:hypothetical protein THRCLA_03686 [Thraustotheca clavata]|uniref:RNA polymerase II subunit B1 CTD phosphatase RPAP2 homolog n=1 Tax=Thraustotheca clavata TaxID=74557 RepID=A0A1W0A199_9STRA|nr:hypothetical protein THRCLA_03686 [Thraustotheca clavata]